MEYTEDAFLCAFDYSRPLSLYIHIPFCTSRCSYCAFYSLAGRGREEKHSYAQEMVRRIDKVTRIMDRPFYTAYIGGGNPGCLEVGDLDDICRAVCRNGRPQEFTVEMNPESLCHEHFPLFEGFLDRLSMGVQSLDPAALEFLGRNAGIEDTSRGISLAGELNRTRGTRISYDLITCLPDFHNPVQDVCNLVETCNPGHLSVYALTPEEGTPLYSQLGRGAVVLPDNDSQADILTGVWQCLESLGYEHYEVSNFALDGMRSLHNSVYWDYGQYMGLGESAHSRAFGKAGVAAFEMRAGQIQGTALTQEEALEEFVLMGLRHRKGLDLVRLEEEFGLKAGLPEIVGFHIRGRFLVPDDSGLMTADAAALAILSR